MNFFSILSYFEVFNHDNNLHFISLKCNMKKSKFPHILARLTSECDLHSNYFNYRKKIDFIEMLRIIFSFFDKNCFNFFFQLNYRCIYL